MSDSLATIEKAHSALTKLRADLVNTTDFEEVRTIGDKAAAMRDILRRMKANLRLANEAAELWIRARRRAGEMINKGHGDGSLRTAHDGLSKVSHGVIPSPPGLKELDVSLMQSSRWQALAKIKEEIFESALEEILTADTDQLTMALLQLTISQFENEDQQQVPPVVPSGTFSTLVVDPPWRMQKIARVVRDRQSGFDYPTMSVDELSQFPITKLAAPSAHLYLWATHKYLPSAFALAEAWGFQYECLLTWVKNVGFTPYSWMRSTEHILFCRRGGLELTRLGLRLDFAANVREHSRKPDEFYQLVREASPAPRVDVFSREPREGFAQAGNQIAHFEGIGHAGL